MKYPNGLYTGLENIDYVKEVRGKKVATSGYSQSNAATYLLTHTSEDQFTNQCFTKWVIGRKYTFVCPELFLEWDDA